MPSRMGPAQTVRIAEEGAFVGNFANVLWAKLTISGALGQADFDAWLGSFHSAWRTAMCPQMPNDLAVTQAVATYFDGSGGALHSIAIGSTAGSLTGDQKIPASACAVVSWKTTAYWRGGKPRTYIPVSSDGAVTGDAHTLNSTYRTNLSFAAAAFMTAANALTHGVITGTSLGFVSFFSGNAVRGTPLFYPFVTNSVHQRIGTQRRRLGKWMP